MQESSYSSSKYLSLNSESLRHTIKQKLRYKMIDSDVSIIEKTILIIKTKNNLFRKAINQITCREERNMKGQTGKILIKFILNMSMIHLKISLITSKRAFLQNLGSPSRLRNSFSDFIFQFLILDLQKNQMNFGNSVEHSQEQSLEFTQVQLQRLSRELKQAIKKAKMLAISCKINNYEQTQYHTNAEGELILPEYKEQLSYNQQFWKKYLKNEINFAIIKDISEKVAELELQVREVEKMNDEYQKIYKIKNRKKNRRLDTEIQKKHQCPYQNCYRIYGSDVSLNLHIKLKHDGGNKTDRQKLAICEAQERGMPIPSCKFNLPKGFLEQYKTNFKKMRVKVKQNLMGRSSIQ